MTVIEQKIQDIVSPILIVKSVKHVNYNPHPYVVGPSHIENSGIILDVLKAERAGSTCAHPGCRLPFADHKSDKVCFLQLTMNTPPEIIQHTLKKAADIFKQENIDGVAFVETKEKFRIVEVIEDEDEEEPES